MTNLPTEELFESYRKAVELKLDQDFIALLLEEIYRRQHLEGKKR